MSQETTPPNTTQEYWCFISYRHRDNDVENDRGWASWLHQEIERYEIPAELVGTENARGDTIPERIYPVFRDEESLPADADLGSSIANALDRSRFLVVLCSPRAVESQYVAQEILHFKKSDKGDRIIAAILDGEPGDSTRECFPESLRHPVREDGSLDTTVEEEPIAANFRLQDGSEGFTSAEAYRLHLTKTGKLPKREIKKRAEAYGEQLQLMKLKIIAGILGVPLETLRDRDKAYQLELARKKARTLRLWLAAVGVLAVAAVVAAVIAYDQRKKAGTAKTAGLGALNRLADDAIPLTVDAGPEEEERRSKFIEILEKTVAEIPESERDRDYERVEAIALSLRSAQDLQEANPMNNPELQLDPGVMAAMAPLVEEMQKGPDKSWDNLNQLLRKAQAAHFAASDQLQAANEKNQRALDMFARLLPLFPKDADLRWRAGTAANLRVQFLASDEEEILAYHSRAVEAFTELGEIDPDRKAESLGHLAETYDRMATFYQNLMEPQRAEPFFSKAAKLRDQISAEYADVLKPTFLNALAGNYEGLAEGLMETPDQAEVQQQKAVELYRKAYDKAADEASQLALAKSLSTLSVIQGQLQKDEPALTSGRDAVSHFEALLKANPSNQQAIEGIASVLENIGRAYLRMGDSNRQQRANDLAARYRERLRNISGPSLRGLDNEQSILLNSATKQLFSGMQSNDPAETEAGIRGLWQQLGLLEHGLWLTRDSLLQQGLLAEPHFVPGYWNKKVELTAQFLRHAFPPNELANQWTAYEQACRAAPPNFLAQGVSPEQLAVARASHDLATGLLAGSPDSNRQTLARVLLTVGQRILTQADASGALDDAGSQRLEAISSTLQQLPKPRFERSVLDELTSSAGVLASHLITTQGIKTHPLRLLTRRRPGRTANCWQSHRKTPGAILELHSPGAGIVGKSLRATGTFQKEIVRPSSCQLVVGILWNCLGTPASTPPATIFSLGRFFITTPVDCAFSFATGMGWLTMAFQLGAKTPLRIRLERAGDDQVCSASPGSARFDALGGGLEHAFGLLAGEKFEICTRHAVRSSDYNFLGLHLRLPCPLHINLAGQMGTPRQLALVFTNFFGLGLKAPQIIAQGFSPGYASRRKGALKGHEKSNSGDPKPECRFGRS